MRHLLTLLIQAEFEFDTDNLTEEQEIYAMAEQAKICVAFFELHGYNVNIQNSELIETDDSAADDGLVDSDEEE